MTEVTTPASFRALRVVLIFTIPECATYFHFTILTKLGSRLRSTYLASYIKTSHPLRTKNPQ